MSEKGGGRKRRKPAKPSKHSPGQSEKNSVKQETSPTLCIDEGDITPPLDDSTLDLSNTGARTRSRGSQLPTMVPSSSLDISKRARLDSDNEEEDQTSLDLSMNRSSASSSDYNPSPVSGMRPLDAQDIFPSSSQSSADYTTVSANRSEAGGTDQSVGGAPDRCILTQYEELKSKAMTSRARRIIANARERNRVHTISSAFEELRRSIPCYSSNQKLSKLAILKIATSYIRCLGHVAGTPGALPPPAAENDFGAPTILPSSDLAPSDRDPKFSELIMRCTINVLSDGKLKRNEVTGSKGSDDGYPDDCID